MKSAGHGEGCHGGALDAREEGGDLRPVGLEMDGVS
jgi:hypothetical protein